MKRKTSPDFTPILNHVKKHIQLDDEETAFFEGCLDFRRIKKKTILLKSGEVCRHSYFVVDGALKSYHLDNKKAHHVISFAVKDWWIADMFSLITQKPGLLTIESIADSEIIMLSRRKQEWLYQRIPKFERFFRILTENSLVANQQRLINNLTLGAEERYLHFVAAYPYVLGCATLNNIASYLGMTPEFLSKIRRGLAKKNLP